MPPQLPPAPPEPKPPRFAYAPNALEAGRTRVMLDYPTEQLPLLLAFLEKSGARSY